MSAVKNFRFLQRTVDDDISDSELANEVEVRAVARPDVEFRHSDSDSTSSNVSLDNSSTSPSDFMSTDNSDSEVSNAFDNFSDNDYKFAKESTMTVSGNRSTRNSEVSYKEHSEDEFNDSDIDSDAPEDEVHPDMLSESEVEAETDNESELQESDVEQPNSDGEYVGDDSDNGMSSDEEDDASEIITDTEVEESDEEDVPPPQDDDDDYAVEVIDLVESDVEQPPELPPVTKVEIQAAEAEFNENPKVPRILRELAPFNKVPSPKKRKPVDAPAPKQPKAKKPKETRCIPVTFGKKLVVVPMYTTLKTFIRMYYNVFKEIVFDVDTLQYDWFQYLEDHRRLAASEDMHDHDDESRDDDAIIDHINDLVDTIFMPMWQDDCHDEDETD